MTKDELRVKVSELELTLSSLEVNAKAVKDDLNKAHADLANINKPIIDDLVVDKMYEVISRCFEDFDPNDYNPEYDFEIDYDGRINVSSLQLQDVDLFAEQLHDRLLAEFRIVNKEDND